MKISFIIPHNNFLMELVPYLEEAGIEVLLNDVDESTDFIISMSISQMELTKDLMKKAPHVPLISFNWDIYEWVWKHKRGADYDFKGYGKLLSESLEVWCPSQCTIDRQKEWYGIDNGYAILSFAQLFEYPEDKIRTGNYVFDPMRTIPDRNEGWLEEVCQELGYPLIRPEHQYNEAQFQTALAECRFIVCPYYEASTGGLSLIEGYRLGKPVLYSDSPYMGAVDYFGTRGRTFRYDSKEDLKKQMKDLWENTPELDITECRKFTDKYKPEVMAKAMINRLKELQCKK